MRLFNGAAATCAESREQTRTNVPDRDAEIFFGKVQTEKMNKQSMKSLGDPVIW